MSWVFEATSGRRTSDALTDASLGGVSRVPLAWHEAAAVLVPDLPPYDVLSAAATRGDGLRNVDARQIELDLHRSHVSSIDVDDGHLDRLRRLLRAWCVLRPEIGYSQAMNFVASVMLHQCEGDEPAAFALFAALMAVLPAPSAGGRGRPPCSSTAPTCPAGGPKGPFHAPQSGAWALWRLAVAPGARLRPPQSRGFSRARRTSTPSGRRCTASKWRRDLRLISVASRPISPHCLQVEAGGPCRRRAPHPVARLLPP